MSCVFSDGYGGEWCDKKQQVSYAAQTLITLLPDKISND